MWVCDQPRMLQLADHFAYTPLNQTARSNCALHLEGTFRLKCAQNDDRDGARVASLRNVMVNTLGDKRRIRHYRHIVRMY
jgi:hypothetical protein